MFKMGPKAMMSNIIGLFREGCDVGKDCVIVTKENIQIESNKIILLQSPFIEQIIQSLKCNCDHPEKLYLLFPDISYRHMSSVLEYFYTGTIRYSQSDKGAIRDILFNIFQISGNRLTDINKDDVIDLTQANENSTESIYIDSGSAPPSPSPEATPASPSPSRSSSFSGGISSPEEDSDHEETSANNTESAPKSKWSRKWMQLKPSLKRKSHEEPKQRIRTPSGPKRSRHDSGKQENTGKTVEDHMMFEDEFSLEYTIDSQEGCDDNIEKSKDSTVDGEIENNAVNETNSDSEETLPLDDEESRSRDFEED